MISMKTYIYIFLLTLTWGCSNFDNESDLTSFNLEYQSITPEKVISDLPVINLTVDSEKFEEMHQQFTEEIEIKGSFLLYRQQELVIENEEVEIELKGNYSKQFSLKSLGIKFEEKYDNRNRNLINPSEVLPHHNIDYIKAIRLRNSGNDFKNTMLKDLSYTQLAIQAGLDLDLTYGEPALVFINEEFYGLLNLRTEANANGMAGLYSTNKNEVTLAKIVTQTLLKKNGDFDRIDALVDAVKRKDLDHLKSEIDLNNFIDYMVFQSYITNVDWPHTNVRFYAIRDSKFRFVLFDLDAANWIDINRSPISLIDKSVQNFVSDLFFALYEEDAFRQQFFERYQFLLEHDEISYDIFDSIVMSNLENIKSEIQLNIEKYQTPETKIEWIIEVDKLIQMFEERKNVIGSLINDEE